MERVDREWYLIATLGKRSVISVSLRNAENKREQEFKRMIDAKERDKQTILRYQAMSGIERQSIDKQVEATLAKNPWGRPGMAGYAALRESTLLDVMEEFYLSGIDRLGSVLMVEDKSHLENGEGFLRDSVILLPYLSTDEWAKRNEAILGLVRSLGILSSKLALVSANTSPL